MITDFGKAIRKILIEDITINGLIGSRVLRAKFADTGSLALDSNTVFPLIVFSLNEEETVNGIPTEKISLHFIALVKATEDIPHETVENIIYRISYLLDNNPDIITNAGYSVYCHELIKDFTSPVMFSSQYNAFYKDLWFNCRCKVNYLDCNV
ncbi:MAG: hypothetical protein GF317_04845 [Candidatus Lokiarchaeota archaeon]|nr:hypothetical protein [Candidatus Lokiarchaeota archaeon]